MNNNVDLKSMKLLVVVVILCVTFVAFLPLAYRNLPQNDVNKTQIEQSDSMENEDDAASIDNAATDENTKQSKNIIEYNEQEELNTAQIPNEQITEEKIDKASLNNDIDLFQKALSLRNDEKYESAVYEYQQIISSTDDNDIKAKCYQEIALTYASIKRYGSALANAQKAYNMNPSTEKELILARLYYKTGNIDKATEHINAILKRDFIE